MVFLTFSQRLTTNETAVSAEFDLLLPLPVTVPWKWLMSQKISIIHQIHGADCKKVVKSILQMFVLLVLILLKIIRYLFLFFFFLNQTAIFSCLPSGKKLHTSVH